MCAINGGTSAGTMARLTGAMSAKNGDTAGAAKQNAYADQLDGKSPSSTGGTPAATRSAKRPATVLAGQPMGKTILGG